MTNVTFVGALDSTFNSIPFMGTVVRSIFEAIPMSRLRPTGLVSPIHDVSIHYVYVHG